MNGGRRQVITGRHKSSQVVEGDASDDTNTQISSMQALSLSLSRLLPFSPLEKARVQATNDEDR